MSDSVINTKPPNNDRKLVRAIFWTHLGMTGAFFVFVFWSAIVYMDDDPATLFQQEITHSTNVLSWIFTPYVDLPYAKLLSLHLPPFTNYFAVPFLFLPLAYSAMFAHVITFGVRLTKAIYHKWTSRKASGNSP